MLPSPALNSSSAWFGLFGSFGTKKRTTETLRNVGKLSGTLENTFLDAWISPWTQSYAYLVILDAYIVTWTPDILKKLLNSLK